MFEACFIILSKFLHLPCFFNQKVGQIYFLTYRKNINRNNNPSKYIINLIKSSNLNNFILNLKILKQFSKKVFL